MPRISCSYGIDPKNSSSPIELQAALGHPTIELLIGAEVIFGQTAKDVFPALYHDIERDIVERARLLRHDLKAKTDPASRKKVRLLNELIKHANVHKPAI